LNSAVQIMKSKIITLLTDFGEEDWFVGSMKGVIASICPGARTVDITHRISPGDIRRGALILRCAYRYFPRGTVHLAVVDPGVGSDRAVLVVRGGGYIFVAPDNGLLSYVLTDLKEKAIFHAIREDLFRDEISDTFHGRDIFAPLAARLAGGLPAEKVGPPNSQPVILSTPVVRPTTDGYQLVEIIGMDRFGNCVTALAQNLPDQSPGSDHPSALQLTINDHCLHIPLVNSYAAVENGKLLAVWGSCGFLELAVNGGNAAQQLGLQVGDMVKVEFNS